MVQQRHHSSSSYIKGSRNGLTQQPNRAVSSTSSSSRTMSNEIRSTTSNQSSMTVKVSNKQGEQTRKKGQFSRRHMMRVSSPQFQMMHITVTVLDLSGIVCQESKVKNNKVKKQNQKAKYYSTSGPYLSSISTTNNDNKNNNNSNSSHNSPIRDDVVPTLALVSFYRNTLSSDTSIATHVPSLPIASPTSRSRCDDVRRSRHTATWPARDEKRTTTRRDKETNKRRSSITFSKVMQKDDVDGSGSLTAEFAPELVDLNVGLVRGKDMIVLGKCTLVITGETDRKELTLPVEKYAVMPPPDGGKRAMKNVDVSMGGGSSSSPTGMTPLRRIRTGSLSFGGLKKKKNSKRNDTQGGNAEGLFLAGDPTKRYAIDDNGTLKVLLSVSPHVEQKITAAAAGESSCQSVLETEPSYCIEITTDWKGSTVLPKDDGRGRGRRGNERDPDDDNDDDDDEDDDYASFTKYEVVEYDDGDTTTTTTTTTKEDDAVRGNKADGRRRRSKSPAATGEADGTSSRRKSKLQEFITNRLGIDNVCADLKGIIKDAYDELDDYADDIDGASDDYDDGRRPRLVRTTSSSSLDDDFSLASRETAASTIASKQRLPHDGTLQSWTDNSTVVDTISVGDNTVRSIDKARQTLQRYADRIGVDVEDLL